MSNQFVINRKRIYANINSSKGNFMTLVKSPFISKDEKAAINKIIDEIENLRKIYFENRGKKENFNPLDHEQIR